MPHRNTAEWLMRHLYLMIPDYSLKCHVLGNIANIGDFVLGLKGYSL